MNRKQREMFLKHMQEAELLCTKTNCSGCPLLEYGRACKSLRYAWFELEQAGFTNHELPEIYIDEIEKVYKADIVVSISPSAQSEDGCMGCACGVGKVTAGHKDEIILGHDEAIYFRSDVDDDPYYFGEGLLGYEVDAYSEEELLAMVDALDWTPKYVFYVEGFDERL
jgi:hypothetical protein